MEELTQSLMPLVAQNGMDWMYANCSTTAQRGALDWKDRFRDAVAPVFTELYDRVKTGKETEIVLRSTAHPITGKSSRRSSPQLKTPRCGRPAPLCAP